MPSATAQEILMLILIAVVGAIIYWLFPRKHKDDEKTHVKPAKGRQH